MLDLGLFRQSVALAQIDRAELLIDRVNGKVEKDRERVDRVDGKLRQVKTRLEHILDHGAAYSLGQNQYQRVSF